MSQFDAAATPLYRCFAKESNLTPFNVIEPTIDINEKNVAVNKNSIRSQKLNLREPDAINDLEFSEIVWQTVKGIDSKMPAPKRSAFVMANKSE